MVLEGEAGVVREHPAGHGMAGAGVAHLLADLAQEPRPP